MIENFFRKLGAKTPPSMIKAAFNIWPPYLGSGIEVVEIAKDYKYLKVCLKRTAYNRNYVGTQYGGSIYSITDPFYMFLIMNNLGSDYVVWDKGATIDFVKPGKTKLSAEFRIDDELLETIRAKTADGDKYIFDLPITVVDAKGETIATVSKKLYVRKKKKEV